MLNNELDPVVGLVVGDVEMFDTCNVERDIVADKKFVVIWTLEVGVPGESACRLEEVLCEDEELLIGSELLVVEIELRMPIERIDDA